MSFLSGCKASIGVCKALLCFPSLFSSFWSHCLVDVQMHVFCAEASGDCCDVRCYYCPEETSPDLVEKLQTPTPRSLDRLFSGTVNGLVDQFAGGFLPGCFGNTWPERSSCLTCFCPTPPLPAPLPLPGRSHVRKTYYTSCFPGQA